jgi:hypothetical protein
LKINWAVFTCNGRLENQLSLRITIVDDSWKGANHTICPPGFEKKNQNCRKELMYQILITNVEVILKTILLS